MPRLAALLQKLGLPTRTDLPASVLDEAALRDKKRSGAEITLVLPIRRGRCILHRARVEELMHILNWGGMPDARDHIARPAARTLDAIPSKSDAHRAILAAALSDGPTDIVLSSFSQDIEATVACAAALGASAVRTPSGLRITPRPHGASARPALFSARAGRRRAWSCPVAAALCAGRGRRRGPAPRAAHVGPLPRPFGKRLPPQRRQAAPRCAAAAGRRCTSCRAISAPQYISGLLFALPLLGGDSVIALTSPLQSSGYVDMTLRTLAAFGIEADARQGGWLVRGGQTYRSPGTYAVEGDYSNSAVWLCAGALGGM